MPFTARIERTQFHRARSSSKKGTWPLPALLADFFNNLLGIAAPNVRTAAEAQSPAPRLRLRSHGTARVIKFGFCAEYPGGRSTDSNAEGPRSVESPESVGEVGTRMSGLTKGQAFDRVWDGVQELRSILVAHETKFQ